MPPSTEQPACPLSLPQRGKEENDPAGTLGAGPASASLEVESRHAMLMPPGHSDQGQSGEAGQRRAGHRTGVCASPNTGALDELEIPGPHPTQPPTCSPAPCAMEVSALSPDAAGWHAALTRGCMGRAEGTY